MNRNLKLFSAYLVLIRLDFWMPVFFLYFSSLFTLERVLLLEAVYYLSVVLLEVPSGYFSDRIGRKWALVVAALAGTASGAIFAATTNFTAFCAAQFFYAMFMAFNSGSDTSLLYDTLKAQNREGEILKVEATAHSKSLFFGAFASVAGGAVALLGFRWAYVLSALAYAAATAVALSFEEPPKTGSAPEATIVKQLGACRARLSSTALKWIFLFYVGRTIFDHIPYEFFQPYLGFVTGAAWLPLVAGVHLAVTKLVSSGFARKASSMERKWGTVSVLLFTHVIVTALILLMAAWVHPVVVFLLLLRNIPHGLGQSVVNAAIHPRVGSGLRATYLSLQSLAGRLAFAATLCALAGWTGTGTAASQPALARILYGMAAFSALWFIGLWAVRPKTLA